LDVEEDYKIIPLPETVAQIKNYNKKKSRKSYGKSMPFCWSFLIIFTRIITLKEINKYLKAEYVGDKRI